MKYDFDEIIDRKGTDSFNVERFRGYIFHADKTMKFPFADDEFIRMWVADMEFASPDVAAEAMRKRLDRRIFGYSKANDDEYYKAFSSWCDKRYGWHCDEKHLRTGSGIVPALNELVPYITTQFEKVLILTPSYAPFAGACEMSGRKFVTCPLIEEDRQYRIDFDDLEKKAADPLVKLLIFCNPHNPTGRVWTEEELARAADICRRNGLYIISDEIHCDLLRVGEKHIPLAKVCPDYPKIITCMAPTKTFNLAGLMISNVIIPDDEIRAVWDARHYSSDNPLSIAAAEAVYNDGEDWLDQMREYLDDNFKYLDDFLKENLPKARFRIPQATYLAWVNVGAYFDSGENLPLFFANKAGVLLEGGSSMFVADADGEIRLNLAMPRSVLKKGLERIAAAIKEK